MRFNADDIEAWAAEYADSDSVHTLVALIEHDRNLPQPSGFPVGSPQRMLAEQRQRVLLKQATSLGYQPPVKEVVATIVKESIKIELLAVSPLAGTSTGDVLDKLPAPEKETIAEKEQKRSRSSRSGGLELGIEL